MKELIEREMLHNGIHFKKLRYWHLKLLPYAGTKVLVKPERSCLKVFDCHGIPICTAKAIIFSAKMMAETQKRSSCQCSAPADSDRLIRQSVS